MNNIFFRTHQEWSTSIIFIFFSTLTSLFIMGVIFPDLLIHHRMVFTHQHDTGIPFEGTFALISHYYNGGIQLWNRFDHMGYSFVHITAGFYTLANLTVAAVYILTSPLFDFPGEAFQSIYSVAFHASTMFIRTVGGYLLLRRLCSNPLIIFVSLIYLNTLLSSHYYMGFLTNSYYSLFPFLIYFILRFFESFKLNDFLGAFLVMTLVVSNCPFMALGYFYQGVHFFLIACLIKAMLTKGEYSFRNLIKTITKGLTKKNFLKIMLVGGVCLTIMTPYLQMERSIEEDYYIPDASYAETEGRMKNKYSIKKYFSKPASGHGQLGQFIRQSLDFTKNMYGSAWIFLGFSTMFFSGLGILLSKDKRKHLFLWTIVLIFLLQYPRDPLALTSISHWINILSNPFSFLIRGPHMTLLLMPYLFLPLLALGIQSIVELSYRRYSETLHYQRIPICLGLLILSLFIYIFYIPGHGNSPETALRFLFFAILVSLVFSYYFRDNIQVPVLAFLIKNKKHLISSFVIIFLLIDLFLLAIYINKNTHSNVRIFPGEIEGLDDRGLVIPIYQNPKLLPFREFFRANPKELVSRDPQATKRYIIRNPQYHDDGRGQDPSSISWYRIYTRKFCYGLFYQFSHLGRFFFKGTIYNPSHATFKNLTNDLTTQKYLTHDQRIFSLADYVIDSSFENSQFDSLLKNRKVVYLEDPLKGLPNAFPSNLVEIPVHDSIILGSATKGTEINSVWAYVTSSEQNFKTITLSAINGEGTILAIAEPPKKDTSNPFMSEFIFKQPILVESENSIRLKLSSPGLITVKQNYETGKFVFFENFNLIPIQKNYSLSFKPEPYRIEGEFADYSFDLPKDFPRHLSSTIFTEDQYNLRVYLGNQGFKPAQGKLIRPFTYDIQNIAKGKLILRLPREYNTMGKKLGLNFQRFSGVTDVWLNEHDNLGINYHAPKDGWFTILFPFDNRWRLTIDDNPVEIHRVNKYFIGTPIQKGQHKILIQYWPDTILRELIFLSLVVMVLTFLFVILWGIRIENSGQSFITRPTTE